MGVNAETFPTTIRPAPVDENDAKRAQVRLNGIRKFQKRGTGRHEEATKVATPSSAPRRDSLSGTPRGGTKAPRCRMSDHAARERVSI